MVLRTQPKRSTPVHVQKRRGEHHKTTTRYAKTYWPYLPMALVVGLGILAQVHFSQPSRVLGASSDLSSAALLQQTNLQRRDHKESALTMNEKLSQAAQAKANDMAARDYWSHDTPDGKQPWDFVRQSGYPYYQVGENLAYGFSGSRETVIAWLNSPEHRQNVLGDYRDVGFGIASAPSFQGKENQVIVVAMYGTPESIVTAQSAQTGVAPTLPETSDTTATGNGTVLSSRHVTRFETLMGGVTKWLVLAVAALSSVAFALIILKHGRMWRRAVKKGELFIIRHPMLDTFVLAVGIVGYLLTRTSGFIH